ncbi:MAG: hypothetical protein JO235_11400 [Chroococcidiopsidaceae cyanobacterium CP_BM_RX_35]|nr:hypothetical protein [Chroococcidiopsidaceae cyanobacterium CP_BM_RX_35]
MKAVEDLKNISSTNSQYKEAQELTWQFQQKIIETLEACANGFDATALNHSSFYKISAGKYIAQIECYLSASQPAYEYYFYSETPNSTEAKPLNLTQFELEYHKISKLESNFITGIPEFNKQTQELLVLQKYGALDDCGTLGTYEFERNKFVLKQFLADFKCGDRKLHYAKIYPINVKTKINRS